MCDQGRNEVRWRPRQETSLAAPCSKLRSFRNTVILTKVFVALLRLFSVNWRPQSDSAPGDFCPPFPPSSRLCVM